MALSQVTKQIRDALNNPFSFVWAKLASTPTAAVDADIVIPAHALMNTAEVLIDPATSDKQGATATSGGIPTTARLESSAASTNATRVKSSAGRIYAIQGYNTAAYTVYLVLYDSTANPPVPGSTTIRKKIPIPPGAAFALDWVIGLYFATGIGYAFTKFAADSDTTAIASADIVQLNIDYV